MKKLLTILVLIMLIISFFQITNMYALYKEQMENENNMLLGAWQIKVNNTEVTSSSQTATFTIDASTQLGYVESDYVQAEKIAPGSQAYFDIVIDPSETDVSIEYSIDIDNTVTSSTNTDINLANIIQLESVDSYFGQGDNGQTNKTDTVNGTPTDGTYTNIIPVDKITQGYKNYIRIYFKWKNIDTDENNEKVDTVLGETEGAKLTIPITVNLKQHTGEEASNES